MKAEHNNSTRTPLIIRAMEFGHDSNSLIIMPEHFEIHVEITDDSDYENHKEPTTLIMFVTFSKMENHDYEESRITSFSIYPDIEVPLELFGEFVIEEPGFQVMEAMLEAICDDISNHIISVCKGEKSYFDLETYLEIWNDFFDELISEQLIDLLPNESSK